MRGQGQGLAVMVRRALARLVARRDILGLEVAGGSPANPAARRVEVNLRRRQGLDEGAVLALCQKLRRMLGLKPGAGLPLLVIRAAAEDVSEKAGADRAWRTGTDADFRCADPAGYGSKAAWIVPLTGVSALLKRKGRRSRSPPSPWSVALSACG